MKKKRSAAFKYLNFAVSFGLTMAIVLYLLYQGGKWLDSRLGTTPLFIILGVLLAIASVFRRLFFDLQILDRDNGTDED